MKDDSFGIDATAASSSASETMRSGCRISPDVVAPEGDDDGACVDVPVGASRAHAAQASAEARIKTANALIDPPPAAVNGRTCRKQSDTSATADAANSTAPDAPESGPRHTSSP